MIRLVVMTLVERNEGARSTAQLNFILNEVKFAGVAIATAKIFAKFRMKLTSCSRLRARYNKSIIGIIR